MEEEVKQAVKEKVKKRVKRSAKNGSGWIRKNWKTVTGVVIAVAGAAVGGYYYGK